MGRDITDQEQRLRELISEANGVTKDLQRAVRDAREAGEEVATLLRTSAAELIDAAVKVGLEELGQHTLEAMDKAVIKVGKQFDALTNILLYGNAQGRGENVVDAALPEGAHVKLTDDGADLVIDEKAISRDVVAALRRSAARDLSDLAYQHMIDAGGVKVVVHEDSVLGKDIVHKGVEHERRTGTAGDSGA